MEEKAIEQVNEFDLRTHIYDTKTGGLKKFQPYRYIVSKEQGSYFVRDGKKYWRSGELAEDQNFPPTSTEKAPKKAVGGR